MSGLLDHQPPLFLCVTYTDPEGRLMLRVPAAAPLNSPPHGEIGMAPFEVTGMDKWSMAKRARVAIASFFDLVDPRKVYVSVMPEARYLSLIEGGA